MTHPRRRTRSLPSFLWGERFTEAEHRQVLDFPTGRSLEIDVFGEAALAKLLATRRRPIADTPTHDIVNFLYTVGQSWKDPGYPIRAAYERNLTDFLGYSAPAAENEANWVAFFLSSSRNLYDALAAELGSWRIFDSWVERGEALVRAFPLGLALHVLPGNVPAAASASLLRSLATRNASVLKSSSSDPFTALALVQSFAEHDPDNPVTRSVSTVFWPRSRAREHGAALAKAADALVLWGGADAIAWGKEHAGDHTELIAFGPKQSLAIVGPEADLRTTARAVAFDASLYDQRACFSTRKVLVHRQVFDRFADHLREALDALDHILPKGCPSLDEAADQSLHREHRSFFGQTIGSGPGTWALFRGGEETDDLHCLGRTVILYPFAEREEILGHLDSSVQTVGVAPWEDSEALRDDLAQRGVSRIVECGFHNIFRIGGSHDGLDPLRRLCRLASNELPSSVHVRGVHLKIDQTDIIENKKFLDFIP